MPQLLLLAATLLGLSTSIASPIGSTSGGTTIDDNYDSLGPSIALGIPQIGLYNGLQYTGWAVAGSVIGVHATGLEVHSPKQGAVAVTTATTATGNPGTVSTGPGVKCFDLKSFYFGCIVNAQQGVAGAASGCSISVSGYRGSTMVGEQAFAFAQPANPLAAPMVLADLSTNPNYKCLTNVTLGAANPVIDPILIIDDLVHENYSH